MLVWTKEEYKKFSEAIIDKPQAYYAFEVLFWTGLRVGELLALTPADIDFSAKTISVTKSYQRIKGEDYITDPKTVEMFEWPLLFRHTTLTTAENKIR